MFKFLRPIQSGIKNLITWFPVIWNDQQWDQYYLLKVLQKKLTLMEKYFRTRGHHVDAEKDADNIKLAINLIGRLIKDDYMESAFTPHKKKYGESTIIFEDIVGKEKYTKLNIKYENQPETEEEIKQERDLFLRCCNKEGYLRQQDLKMLFDHLKKHMLTWWD
jgi:hypothetical protein